MTKGEMVHIIQARYQEAVREYRAVHMQRPHSTDHSIRMLAHLNEVRYIANLLGIELRMPQDGQETQKEE